MQDKKLLLALLTINLLGFSPFASLSHAQSQETSNLYHRSLAATCANCHGTDGNGVINGGMPLINNLSSDQILNRLKEFKFGAREGTVMPQLTKGYSDEQLAIIANQLGKK
jgi:cytochrome c553